MKRLLLIMALVVCGALLLSIEAKAGESETWRNFKCKDSILCTGISLTGKPKNNLPDDPATGLPDNYYHKISKLFDKHAATIDGYAAQLKNKEISQAKYNSLANSEHRKFTIDKRRLRNLMRRDYKREFNFINVSFRNAYNDRPRNQEEVKKWKDARDALIYDYNHFRRKLGYVAVTSD